MGGFWAGLLPCCRLPRGHSGQQAGKQRGRGYSWAEMGAWSWGMQNCGARSQGTVAAWCWAWQHVGVRWGLLPSTHGAQPWQGVGTAAAGRGARAWFWPALHISARSAAPQLGCLIHRHSLHRRKATSAAVSWGEEGSKLQHLGLSSCAT